MEYWKNDSHWYNYRTINKTIYLSFFDYELLWNIIMDEERPIHTPPYVNTHTRHSSTDLYNYFLLYYVLVFTSLWVYNILLITELCSTHDCSFFKFYNIDNYFIFIVLFSMYLLPIGPWITINNIHAPNLWKYK